MKSVGERVNLIPVIAKADTLTPEELKAFKQMVLAEIATHDIKVFQIPEPTALQQQLDPELAQENKKYKVSSWEFNRHETVAKVLNIYCGCLC